MTEGSGTGDKRLDAWVAASMTKPWSVVMREWLSGAFYSEPLDLVTEAIRGFTLDWLAERLAAASGAAFPDARRALTVAIPDDARHVLDGGEAFILAVDQAAIALGCDPWSVPLRPQQLNS